jgi:uncharacterized OB-fold protein
VSEGPKTPPYATPGTPLRDQDLREGRVLTIPGAADVRYQWDTGVAIGRYLAELKNGRLVGRKCARCQRVLVPPRMFCEQCFVPTTEWVELADTGTVQTLAICHIAWDTTRLTRPEIPAVIAIDGASPGYGILHMLGEVEPERARVGQRVRAAWRPAEERTGAITDILYFRPTEE